jgi:hypothetical protein
MIVFTKPKTLQYLRSGVIIVEFGIDLDVVVGDLEDIREVDNLFLDVITDEADLTTGAEQGLAFITSKTWKTRRRKTELTFHSNFRPKILTFFTSKF